MIGKGAEAHSNVPREAAGNGACALSYHQAAVVTLVVSAPDEHRGKATSAEYAEPFLVSSVASQPSRDMIQLVRSGHLLPEGDQAGPPPDWLLAQKAAEHE